MPVCVCASVYHLWAADTSPYPTQLPSFSLPRFSQILDPSFGLSSTSPFHTHIQTHTHTHAHTHAHAHAHTHTIYHSVQPRSDQVVPLLFAAAAARWPVTRQVDAPAIVLDCLQYIFETKAEAPSTPRARISIQKNIHRLLDDILHGGHGERALDVAECLASHGFEMDERAFTCIGLIAAEMGEKGINPLLELTGLSLFDVAHCNHTPRYPALTRALASSQALSRDHMQSKGLRWVLTLMMENDASERGLTLIRSIEATGVDAHARNEALMVKLLATSESATPLDLERALLACRHAKVALPASTMHLLAYACPVKDSTSPEEDGVRPSIALDAARRYVVRAHKAGLINMNHHTYARHVIRFFYQVRPTPAFAFSNAVTCLFSPLCVAFFHHSLCPSFLLLSCV